MVNIRVGYFIIVTSLTIHRQYSLFLAQLTSLCGIVFYTIRYGSSNSFTCTVFFGEEIGLTSDTWIRSIGFKVFTISYILSLTTSNTIYLYKTKSSGTRRTRSNGLYFQTISSQYLLALTINIKEVFITNITYWRSHIIQTIFKSIFFFYGNTSIAR